MIPTIKEEFECNLVQQDFFSINEEQAGLILSLLRNNIYKDVLLAAFKEPFSNSLDEHVKHGINKPIDIYLPTSFSPFFSVRDYANGLSKDFMKTKYTKVGLSTKSDTNELLGGMGIGRMSPLAYTEMYSVTSISEEKEGRVKCEYIVSRDNNKVFCSLLLEELTTEETGVKVSFEIKQKDWGLLESYVKYNTKYLFNIKVNINEQPIQPIKAVQEGRFYKLFNDNNLGLVVLIGGLPNIIRINEFKNDLSSTDYYFVEYKLLGHNKYIAFEAEIGEVSQSADKSIQLNNKTKKYLANILSLIVKEVKDNINQEIEKFNTWDEVYKYLNDLQMFYSPIKWKDNLIHNETNWLKNTTNFCTNKEGELRRSNNKRAHYNNKKLFYYNDLDYIPNTKELKKYFPDLLNLILINDVDNSQYKFKTLSSIIPAKTVTNKKSYISKSNNNNNKCYKLSTYPDTLGRELNIDTSVNKFYISKGFYDLHKNIKDTLFKFYPDIYVVNDVDLVKDHWTDIITSLKNKFKDLDSNFFLYQKHRIKTINVYLDKQDFINTNPNHIISKFLIEAIKFDQYNGYLNSLLNLKKIIQIKEAKWDIDKLVFLINKTYPLANSCSRRNLLEEYIKQIDYYNKLETNDYY